MRGKVARNEFGTDPTSEARELMHDRLTELAEQRWPELIG